MTKTFQSYLGIPNLGEAERSARPNREDIVHSVSTPQSIKQKPRA